MPTKPHDYIEVAFVLIRKFKERGLLEVPAKKGRGRLSTVHHVEGNQWHLRFHGASSWLVLMQEGWQRRATEVFQLSVIELRL
jgi:hypothetical protein